MNDTVAIVLNIQTFNELASYLSGKPFAEVQGFFQAFQQSTGISQSQIDLLNSEIKEEAPE